LQRFVESTSRDFQRTIASAVVVIVAKTLACDRQW
jgi:hypothetical protein